MSLRILSIIGTRPEAVKMAPVLHELRRTPGIESLLCVTGQHREMLDQVLNLFNIIPDIDLNLMRPHQTLAKLTSAVFSRLDPVLSNLTPDWVLIQGDTTTVMATSLLAYYHRIKIGHIEAGLRTGDKWQPFPEEVNRRVASVVTDLHFAPTEWSRQNLLRENIPDHHIIVTGNPVIDALQSIAKMAPNDTVQVLLTRLRLEPADEQPQSPDVGSARIILVTAHRRENFGEPLENICSALRQLTELYGDTLRIIYPVHLNPNVWRPVHQLLGDLPNISLLRPLPYLSWVHLMKRATLILTDSGGVQEEAPALGIPVLVMRQVTERPEGIQAGTVRLVGTQTECIVQETRRLLENPQAYAEMAHAANPYGDGQAAPRIVQAILNYQDS